MNKMFETVAIFMIVIGLIFFLWLIFRDQRESVPRSTLRKPSNVDPESKVVVVFGASGSVGFKIIENLLEIGGYTIVGVSRKYDNWYRKIQDKEHIRDKVQWTSVDTRLIREVKHVIEKIAKIYGKIDVFVNASVIGRPGGIPFQYSTVRDRTDVMIRLPNAFPIKKEHRENSDMFFTNFIGLSNLLRMEIQTAADTGCQTIINPSDVDDFTDVLLRKYCTGEISRHLSILQTDLRTRSSVHDLIQK